LNHPPFFNEPVGLRPFPRPRRSQQNDIHA
jgi:hypothetical protein